jgi:hypothetical protein
MFHSTKERCIRDGRNPFGPEIHVLGQARVLQAGVIRAGSSQVHHISVPLSIMLEDNRKNAG